MPCQGTSETHQHTALGLGVCDERQKTSDRNSTTGTQPATSHSHSPHRVHSYQCWSCCTCQVATAGLSLPQQPGRNAPRRWPATPVALPVAVQQEEGVTTWCAWLQRMWHSVWADAGSQYHQPPTRLTDEPGWPHPQLPRPQQLGCAGCDCHTAAPAQAPTSHAAAHIHMHPPEGLACQQARTKHVVYTTMRQALREGYNCCPRGLHHTRLSATVAQFSSTAGPKRVGRGFKTPPSNTLGSVGAAAH